MTSDELFSREKYPLRARVSGKGPDEIKDLSFKVEVYYQSPRGLEVSSTALRISLAKGNVSIFDLVFILNENDADAVYLLGEDGTWKNDEDMDMEAIEVVLNERYRALNINEDVLKSWNPFGVMEDEDLKWEQF